MKLRHIALSVPNVAQAQKFFEEAFGMTKAGDSKTGVFMTDGTVNVALINVGGVVDGISGPFYGVLHFGLWVDDIKEAQERVSKAGAVYQRGTLPDDPNSHYEIKYRAPSGLIFDITAGGWVGAVKNVKPAD